MQEEPLFPPTATHKLYKERAVLIGTFLGGPLVGGYLIAQNFKALDEPAKAGQTWLVSFVVLGLLLASGLVPLLDKLPTFVYSFAVCLVAHTATKNLQGQRIVQHEAAGGLLHSTWRAALIGIGGGLLMLACFVGLFYLVSAGE